MDFPDSAGPTAGDPCIGGVSCGWGSLCYRWTLKSLPGTWQPLLLLQTLTQGGVQDTDGFPHAPAVTRTNLLSAQLLFVPATAPLALLLYLGLSPRRTSSPSPKMLQNQHWHPVQGLQLPAGCTWLESKILKVFSDITDSMILNTPA